jgi:hypothetical protein
MKFENNANLTQIQIETLYYPGNFPLHIDKMPNLLGNNLGKLEEVTEITFDRFWEEYGYKKGKVRAQAEWNKLPFDEHVMAIAKIKPYKFACQTHNHEMIYPERYLKHKRYTDE